MWKKRTSILSAAVMSIALVMGLGLASCSTSDNPTVDPEEGVVPGLGEMFEWDYIPSDPGDEWSLIFTITSEPTEENPEQPREVRLTGYGWLPDKCDLDIPATVNHNRQEYTVTAIGDKAFEGYLNLSSVTIPASVKSIGERAFLYCNNIVSVSFADDSQLETIGYQVFYSCYSLAAITIPASVITISDGAFGKCSSLASVSFADDAQLETIGHEAFNSCTSLETITLPASVKEIGDAAFDGCTSLKTVYLNSHPKIGDWAFPNGVELK